MMHAEIREFVKLPAEAQAPRITQPWSDHRLKIDGKYIGCVRKDVADHILALQTELAALKRQSVRQAHALDQIAFGHADSLAGNPLLWPSTLAYLGLGGRIEEGQRLDSRETLVGAASSN
jgi:hypothetical protein